MKNPSVSIILTAYNDERYLKICVDSILAQNFQDFEIILVDDASTDKTFALCQKFYGGNKKIKLIRQEKHFGAGSARNAAIKQANGKYLCFVSGKDLIMPTALKKFYDAAENSQAEIVHASGQLELNQDDSEPVRQENLKLRWDKFPREGLLTNNLLQRLELWRNGEISPQAEFLFCQKDFLENRHVTFLSNDAADEVFNFSLMCLAPKYYVLRDAFYVNRKLSTEKFPAQQKYFDSIVAMISGAAYIEKFLDKFPRIKGQELWWESILSSFFNRMMARTVPLHKNFLIDAEWNSVAEKALTPLLPQGKSFVKYFFNAANVLRKQNEFLAQRTQNLSAQMISLFNRMEISKDKIVFVNFLGRGYGCNPKYIAEEILRQNLPFELVWLVNDLNAPMPEKIRKVAYGSVDSVYELATAKIIVSNTKNLLPFPGKKRGQFFIMTWHGGQGFKWIEGDAEKKLSPDYLANTKANSKITDLMMVNTQEQFDEFRRACYYDGEILKIGLPRNDLFFKRDEKLIARVRKSLNVPPSSKIIMYAPTFRDNVSNMLDACRLDMKRLLKVMQKKFGGDWTLLMRFHPNVSALFEKNSFNSDKIINVTNYPDMQELILISDVLISDYSSVICDFMFCDKPVFIYAKDFDTYPTERGFKPLFFELPYKINKSATELFTCIENFDAAALKPKVQKFIDTVKPFDDGHASEKVVAIIKDVISGNR